MIQHIATTPRRLAADPTTGPGAQQAGPTQNGIVQGQCFVDVAGGVAQAAMGNFAGLAGAVVGAMAGGTFGAVAGAGTTGLINASQAAFGAFKSSEACQQLDNAGLANELGVGAIVAP